MLEVLESLQRPCAAGARLDTRSRTRCHHVEDACVATSHRPRILDTTRCVGVACLQVASVTSTGSWTWPKRQGRPHHRADVGPPRGRRVTQATIRGRNATVAEFSLFHLFHIGQRSAAARAEGFSGSRDRFAGARHVSERRTRSCRAHGRRRDERRRNGRRRRRGRDSRVATTSGGRYPLSRGVDGQRQARGLARCRQSPTSSADVADGSGSRKAVARSRITSVVAHLAAQGACVNLRRRARGMTVDAVGAGESRPARHRATRKITWE